MTPTPPLLPPEPKPSPTGKPLIPVEFIPIATVIAAGGFIASILAAPTTIVGKIGHAILGVAALLGIASPGWRTR